MSRRNWFAGRVFVGAWSPSLARPSDDAADRWASAKRTDGGGSLSLLARHRADPTADGAGVLVACTQRDERDEEDTEPANVLGHVVRTLISAVLADHRNRAQEVGACRQPEDDQHPARLRDDAQGAVRATEHSWTATAFDGQTIVPDTCAAIHHRLVARATKLGVSGGGRSWRWACIDGIGPVEMGLWSSPETWLQELLEGTKQYQVPLYQRTYSWTRGQPGEAVG